MATPVPSPASTDVTCFVLLGSPRSGTTFLLDVLSALDHVDGVAGQVLPSQLGPLVAAGRLDEDARGALGFAVRASLADFVRLQQRVRSRTVSELLRRNVGTREALEGLRARRRLRAVVYKEPFLSFVPSFVHEALPEARFIVIHRDGRDVGRSLVRTYGVLTDERLRDPWSNEVVIGRSRDGRIVPWWVDEGEESAFLGASPYLRAVWLWREMVRALLRFERAADAEVLSLRYEDLMRDPIEVGQRLARWSGVPLTRRASRHLTAARTASIGSHRDLDPDEQRRATELASAELSALGYR